MQKVGNLLSRFKHLKAPERSVQQAVAQAIKDMFDINVDKKLLKVNKSILYINLNSVIKASVFENKKNLISRINSILGKDQIKDLK